MNKAAIAAVWEQQRPAMLARVDVLERAIAGPLEPALVTEALTAAHQLAGSVGTFGFARASELARGFETMLRDDPEAVSSAASLVARLRGELDDEPAFFADVTERATLAPVTQAPLILFVTRDASFGMALRTEAARRGLRASSATGAAEAATAARNEAPAVIVAAEAAAYALLDLSTSVVVYEARDALHARLKAARKGAAAYLTAGATPVEILDATAYVLERTTARRERVALVGEAEGLDDLDVVQVDAADFPSGLEAAEPAVVVLADKEAADLCAVLRNDPRWATVSVVALSSEPVPGADDVVADPADLGAHVHERLERARALAALADTDPASGAGTRRASALAMSRLIRLAERHTRELCVVAIELDDPADAPRVGRVLRRSLRTEDVVGRWADGRFVLAMLGINRELAVHRIDRLRIEAEAGLSAGIAEFPAEGTDLEALYRSAGEALRATRRDTPVMAAGRGPGAVKQVDVAIVEDEDGAAELMGLVLGERGYSSWRFSNGAGAVAMLAGDKPEVRAGIILLDLNLPAVDGVELLTLLGRDGVLRNTRLVVVSGNDDPKVIARVRELGAEDYLIKPVDLSVLAATVDQLLGRRRPRRSRART